MGNTTSDRVAGERHGAKAARAEGASGHGLDREHKIMVGSTDDPSLFSLPDSKVSVPTPPVGGDSAAACVSGFLLPFLVLITRTWDYGFLNQRDFSGTGMLDGNSSCSIASK